MPNDRLIRTSGVRYAPWKGEVIAKYLLARTDGVEATDLPPHDPARCDIMVEAGDFRFLVEVKAFASFHDPAGDPATSESLRIRVPFEQFEAWRRSALPVVVFLIDADTEHGRYLIVDDVSAGAHSGEVDLAFPVANELTPEAVPQVISRLRARHPVGRIA